jgi:hypothetical protein
VCAGSVAGLARPGQTQSCERNHANVTFYFFLIHESVARGIPLMLENLRRFPPRRHAHLPAAGCQRNLVVNLKKIGEN